MAKQISEGIFKIIANSNIYVILQPEPFLIDAGDKMYKTQVLSEIKEIIDPKEIKKILLTHLHYDHIGNLDLFPNAEIFVHREEIDSFRKSKFETTLSEDTPDNLDLKPLDMENGMCNLEIIYTPGHTNGCVCFFLKERKIMFTGDTLFYGNNVGRTDLPTSVPDKLHGSLNILFEHEFDIMCPGHDY